MPFALTLVNHTSHVLQLSGFVYANARWDPGSVLPTIARLGSGESASGTLTERAPGPVHYYRSAFLVERRPATGLPRCPVEISFGASGASSENPFLGVRSLDYPPELRLAPPHVQSTANSHQAVLRIHSTREQEAFGGHVMDR